MMKPKKLWVLFHPFLLLVVSILCPSGSLAVGITLPLNVGAGPSVDWLYSPFGGGKQRLITGIDLDMYAVVKHEVIAKVIDRVPRRWRRTISPVKEARVGFLFIPRTLYVSPERDNLQAVGAAWQPLMLGNTLGRDWPVRLYGGIPLDLVYLHLKDQAAGTTMNYFSAGLGLKADLEVYFTRSVMLSMGGQYVAYIPKKMADGKKLWNIVHTHILLNIRIPMHVKLI